MIQFAAVKQVHSAQPHMYSLAREGSTAPYYTAVRIFGSDVQQYLRKHHQQVQQWNRWRNLQGMPEECDLEASVQWLTLSVRLQGWGSWCASWSERSSRALRSAVRFRRRYRMLADGALAVLYGSGIPAPEKRQPTDTWTLPSLEALVRIMETLPDFSEEGRCYRSWLQYADGLAGPQQEEFLEGLWQTALWFEGAADDALGWFTKSQNHPTIQPMPAHRFREDRILRSIRPVDYHLALTAAELLNRAYREDFSRTKMREVLVPACLCGPKCQRVKTDLGVRCQQCSALCQVGRLVSRGTKHSFGVLIISHASRAFPKALDAAARGGTVGIVGVACPAHLLAGGWACRRQNIPAQCVPLDFPGCSHWREQPAPTMFNMDELLQLVGS